MFKFLIATALYLFHNGQGIVSELILILVVDVIITPVIIQISYLGCNKRNLNTLLNAFELRKFVRVILDQKESSTVYTTTNHMFKF